MLISALPALSHASPQPIDPAYQYGSLITLERNPTRGQHTTHQTDPTINQLLDRYQCPSNDDQPLSSQSRFAAATSLGSCLDQLPASSEETLRLAADLSPESQAARWLPANLESKVDALMYANFSKTTTLRGEAIMNLNGVPDYPATSTGKSTGTVTRNNQTAFNYRLRLYLDTSFTGFDLLHTRLGSGNFSDLPFGTSSNNILKLDKSDTSHNALTVNRLYYRFPLSSEFTAFVGSAIENHDMLAMHPSLYHSLILDAFQRYGSAEVYNKAGGAGIGLTWRQRGISKTTRLVAGVNVVVQNANNPNYGITEATGGINALAQLGLTGSNFGFAIGYRHGTTNSSVPAANGRAGNSLQPGQIANNLGISGYWQPSDSGLIPSISLGYGFGHPEGTANPHGPVESQSWMAGLEWDDVLAKGNTFGLAIGQPSKPNRGVGSDAWLAEIFYRSQISDKISVTPAIFYANDLVSSATAKHGWSGWGGVIQARLTF